MYMKNLGPEPDTEVQYEGLKRDGKFRFPHAVKYVAWFLLVASIVTSSVVLIYYGMSFGMIKTYLWMTGIAALILQSIFLVAPIRITILSFIKGGCLKLEVVLIKRPISSSLVSNPYKPLHKKEILRLRKYNARFYKPIPLSKLQSHIEEVKYNIELRNLTVDVITHVFFMITVFYIVLINKTTLGYFSTNVVENLVVRGSYTNSLPFTNVTTYDTLLEYLNKTLLPALLIDYRDYEKLYLDFNEENSNKNKRRRRQFLPRDRVRKDEENKSSTLSLDGFDDYLKSWENGSEFNERGWTMEPSIKLIGKPRIRQVRVTADSCTQYKDIESRNVECAAELSLLNVETGNFTLRWDPWPAKGLTPAEAEPWIYRSGWETKTMPISAKFTNYPWGGYILNFGRSINDSRIVLEYLDTFEWIDMKTRGIFIEFTTYCVNINVFNVVTLIAEKSATGYIIPSFKIETCRFLFLQTELEVISIVMIILFSLLLFFFFLRESIRMHRTSVWAYFKRTFALLDLTIIFFGVLSLVFLILRSSYVESLLKELELSDNNEFVSFILASYWHTLSIYIEAVLVCLAAFKVFRLLIFRVIFFQLQTTLSHCYKQFVDLVIQILTLALGFALFFYLCLNVYAYCFSTFAISISTTIGRSVLLDDTFDISIFNSSPWYLAPVLFALFIIVITFLFINMFIAVICLYFSSIRKISLRNKYSMSRYIKYVLTSNRKSDLFRINVQNSLKKQNQDPLRLKGGGNRLSKGKSAKKKNRRIKRKKTIPEEEEFIQIYLRQFVKEKLYEIIKYQGLAEERALTMKYLTIYILTDEGDKKKRARENALMAYFATITSGRATIENKTIGNQFVLVAKKSEKEVVKRRRLLEMKKIVEEYGKQKGWVVKEDTEEGWDAAQRFKNDIDVLYKKVDDLFNRSSKIKHVL